MELMRRLEAIVADQAAIKADIAAIKIEQQALSRTLSLLLQNHRMVRGPARRPTGLGDKE
jgi:hypothetical protein